MFLVERLIGVSTYIAVLCLVCNALWLRVGSTKRCLQAYVVILTVMAFFFVPQQTSDVYRLTEFMHKWVLWPFEKTWQDWLKNGDVLSGLYVYLIGLLRVDALLPAITCCFFFSLVFSCFWDYVKQTGCSGSIVALSVFVFMSTGIFATVIGGIRNYLAFALCFWCIYHELVCGRKIIFDIPLYIIACAFHSSAIFITIIRFFVFVLAPAKNMIIQYHRLIAVAILSCLAARYGFDRLFQVADKVQGYLYNDVYIDIWGYFIYGFSLICSAMTYRQLRVLAKKRNRVPDKIGKPYVDLLGILVLASFASIPLSYTFFIRLSMFAAMMSLPASLGALSILKRDKTLIDNYIEYRTVLIAASCLVLFIAGTRGDLSGYKFFVQ